MGDRRALLIGAQNDRFGRLSFVDEVMHDLADVIYSEDMGGCRPALPRSSGVITGTEATWKGIQDSLEASIRLASSEHATLFVYYLGHGVILDEDMYLIATDTVAGGEHDSLKAVKIGERIKELLRLYLGVDGLLLILDTCHAGAQVTDPVPGLLRAGVQSRLEIVAATSARSTAENGCFTRSLIRLFRSGVASNSNVYLRAGTDLRHLPDVAPQDCKSVPAAQYLAVSSTHYSDDGLWLTRNRTPAVRQGLLGTQAAEHVARLAQGYIRTSSFDKLMALMATASWPVAVTGGAGTGKSALLAALGQTHLAGEPSDTGLDALVTVRRGDTLASITPVMRDQIMRSAPFVSAQETMTVIARGGGLPVFETDILEPLRHLRGPRRVLVGVDAADQLSSPDQHILWDGFVECSGALLIVTGRRFKDIPPECILRLPDSDRDGVAQYLEIAVADPHIRLRISHESGGDWLLARVLASLAKAGHFRPESLTDDQYSLGLALDAAIEAAQRTLGRFQVDAVQAALAAVPTRAVAPIAIVARAVGLSMVVLRDVLVALGEVVARSDPGTADERLGAAHDRIREHMLRRLEPETVTEMHLRLADTMRVPVSDSIIGAYRALQLPEHLWQAGRTAEALSALEEMEDAETAADALASWVSWRDRCSMHLGPRHPETFFAARKVAYWTGQVRGPRHALTILSEVSLAQERELGGAHPDTFLMRLEMAHWAGRGGDAAGALSAVEGLLVDIRGAGGLDELELLARHEEAHWVGESGDRLDASSRCDSLVRDCAQFFGGAHVCTLAARREKAYWDGQAHGPAIALQELHDLRSGAGANIPPNSRAGLSLNYDIACWKGLGGDLKDAIAALRIILIGQERSLGSSHPDCLTTKQALHGFLLAVGRRREAEEGLRQLLSGQASALGERHPDTLTTLAFLAHCSAEANLARGAALEESTVAQLRIDVQGPRHPDTLRSRHNAAAWVGQSGSIGSAAVDLRSLLIDEINVLEAPDPLLAATRNCIKLWGSRRSKIRYWFWYQMKGRRVGPRRGRQRHGDEGDSAEDISLRR
ncbi:MAG: hypothetical protein WAL50_20140 [Kineosporiaceae bacterium]